VWMPRFWPRLFNARVSLFCSVFVLGENEIARVRFLKVGGSGGVRAKNGGEAGKSGIWRRFGGCSGKWGVCSGKLVKSRTGALGLAVDAFGAYVCSLFWLGRILAGQAEKIQSDSQNAIRVTPAIDFARP